MSLAVGVMARAPVAGSCKTRLLGAFDATWVAELYGAMLLDTLATLERLEAATQIVFLAPGEGAEAALAPLLPSGWQLVLQCGDDLGARIDHAFATMFERGAGCAVVSGSDAPTFRFEPLAEALSSMRERSGEVLLAPCDDGGYSLVALTRREPRLFASMPWSTSSVLAETRRRADASNLHTRELTTGYDVDEPADVSRLAEELRDAPQRAPRTARVLEGSAASMRQAQNGGRAPRSSGHTRRT